MDTEEGQCRRFPSLVQLCQRAATSQVDSIYSLGDRLSYPLVKPILERCSIDQLLRLEQSSPHLKEDTPEIWKDLCFRKYRLTAEERYTGDDDPQTPDSWKSRYFALQDAEAKRIEEVGSKLRIQRMEEVERKKEREIKYSDRLPVAKRPRTGWNTNVQPKTLFQKTRSEASKFQRAFNARVLPPMPTSKNYRALPQAPGTTSPWVPSSSSSDRVTVTTVTHQRPVAPSRTVASRNGIPKDKIPMSKSVPPQTDKIPATLKPLTPPKTISKLPDFNPVQPKPSPTKKDPMASLFVPKRKAHPQR